MFPVLIYFMYTGVYFYHVKIDAYIISITSFRTISSFFTNKSYVDISHLMLEDYKFISKQFSLNTILMLKFRQTKGLKHPSITSNLLIKESYNLELATRGIMATLPTT